MDYLTNYYKNKCNQLQEQVNGLQYKLHYLNERIDRTAPPPPELLRNTVDDYYTDEELQQFGGKPQVTQPNPRFAWEDLLDPFNFIPYAWPFGLVDIPNTYAYEHNPETGQPYFPSQPYYPANGPTFPLGGGNANPGL
jgi:hypothetical protein